MDVARAERKRWSLQDVDLVHDNTIVGSTQTANEPTHLHFALQWLQDWNGPLFTSSGSIKPSSLSSRSLAMLCAPRRGRATEVQ